MVCLDLVSIRKPPYEHYTYASARTVHVLVRLSIYVFAHTNTPWRYINNGQTLALSGLEKFGRYVCTHLFLGRLLVWRELEVSLDLARSRHAPCTPDLSTLT